MCRIKEFSDFFILYKMTNMLTPSFHVYYSKQLNQLPRSIKIDIWRRLTSRKYPLSLEQASSINPEVGDLLNQAVKNYINKKERQRVKPITSECEILSRENWELRILKQEMEKQIEDLTESQDQHKARERAMSKSLEESGEKITQLSSSVTFSNDVIHDIKKAIASAEKTIDMLENKCRHLEDIVSAKDRKIIALDDQTLHSDATIEPKTYSSDRERDLWAKRRKESEYDLEFQKKYTFRSIHSCDS
jgi:chromosome segregation ATPase